MTDSKIFESPWRLIVRIDRIVKYVGESQMPAPVSVEVRSVEALDRDGNGFASVNIPTNQLEPDLLNHLILCHNICIEQRRI